MRICDLTQFYSPVGGGVKRYLQEKVRYLQENTTDVEHILIIPGKKDEVILSDRVKVYSIKSPLISKTSRYRALLRLNVVEKILENEKPDVIESGDPYQMAWKAVTSGQALGIPVIGFYHSHFPEAYLRSAKKFLGDTAMEFVMDAARRYICKLYNRFSRTLVPSPVLAKVLQDWGVDNVTTIDLGVNPDIFNVKSEEIGSVRTELGLAQHQTLLLYVGRLAHEKNTRTLFTAFEILTSEYPGRFHLLAVGDGLQRNLLQELQKKTNAVTWFSYCTDSIRLAQLYRAADLFVHPGVQETFGLVTLESQACGTPVVGIRGSYMDRIIYSDQTTWAKENTAQALAAAILETSQEDLKTMSAAISQKVTDLYSWNRVFDRLFDVYRTVIADYKKS